MTSLYVHIPFCPSKCGYCVYCSKGGASDTEIAAYLKRLHAEIDFYAPAFAGTSFDAWSIGGGTPTILSVRDLDAAAAWLADAGRPHHKEAAMAKLYASEAGARVCDQAARVLASYGFAMEYPVQRYLRDVRFTLIGGGTSEILKLIIAKELSK